MKAGELQKALEDHSGSDDDEGRPLISAALIEWTSRGGVVERGIAIVIGENMTKLWQSGDVIVWWDDGDRTMLVGGEIEPDTEIKVFKFGAGFNLLDRRVL